MFKIGSIVEVIDASETDEYIGVFNGMIGEVVGIRNSIEVQVTFQLGNMTSYSFYPMYTNQLKLISNM